MGDMKKAFDEYFSYTKEEEERLSKVADALLELLKVTGLTIRETVYVLSECRHSAFLEGIGEVPKD